LLMAIIYYVNIKVFNWIHYKMGTTTKTYFDTIVHASKYENSFNWVSQDRCPLPPCLILRIIILIIFSRSEFKCEIILHKVSLHHFLRLYSYHTRTFSKYLKDASVLIIVIIKFRRLFLHFISIHWSSVRHKIKCSIIFRIFLLIWTHFGEVNGGEFRLRPNPHLRPDK